MVVLGKRPTTYTCWSHNIYCIYVFSLDCTKLHESTTYLALLCGEFHDWDPSSNTATGHAPCIDPVIENGLEGYCYDAAGNLTDESGCPAAGSPHRYTYDGANRLISVNNGTATASYTYIGPLRVKKNAGGTTTLYIYSGTRPLAEYINGQLDKNNSPQMNADIRG